MWENPLQSSGLGISIVSLAHHRPFGLGFGGLDCANFIGPNARITQDIIYMVIRVFSLLGLLYLLASVTKRSIRLVMRPLGCF